MAKRFLIAFESSCDDTAVAITDLQGKVLAETLYSQIAEHAAFGGVVPEIASRQHMGRIARLCEQVIEQSGVERSDIAAVAATIGPGLIGSLLVGAQFAKGFAQALRVPFIGVHHIEGHIFAGEGEEGFLPSPFIALVVSGGHTALYRVEEGVIQVLGETRDDAAGEAFDKIARLLGLAYPGGKLIDELAAQGNSQRFSLPTALKMRSTYDFSFSGLKTAARLLIEKLEKEGQKDYLHDLCASLQSAIVEALLRKAFLACQQEGIKRLVIAGGVSANSLLRSEALKRAEALGIQVFVPPKKLCTDNAVMIARAGLKRYHRSAWDPLSISVQSSMDFRL